MSDEESNSNSDQIRRKCIIDYVKKNPECEKEDVIIHCTEIGAGSRVTLGTTIKMLIEEGILNDGKKRKNSKSYKLTVVSENVLLVIPQDLEYIFTEFEKFTKTVKKRFNSNSTIGYKILSNRNSRKFEYESKSSFPFLPYYVIEIINSLYTFYFNFILPKKIENKNVVTRLYSLYFKNLSSMYSIVLEELGDIIPNSNDIPAKIKSKMYKGHFESEQPELFPIYRTARMCRINGIEKELYIVLDMLWKKNEESCELLYALDLNPKIQDSHFLSSRKSDNLFEDANHIQNNKTLRKIHLLIDYYIYQQEKGEEEAEREEYYDAYNPFD